MISKKKLLEQLDKVRLLETSFPAYSPDGVVRERKCHLLLTYTPKNYPIAEERFALTARQAMRLFNDIYEYIANSAPTRKAGRRRCGGSGERTA